MSRSPYSLLVATVVLAGSLACTITRATANTYQIVYDENASWADAQAAASAAGGYLVSITSAEEQTYVECLIVRSNPPRAGAFWTGLREVTEGTYTWDNGEALSYTHWYPGEPNNGAGVESRGHMLWSDDLSRRGYWNDAPPAGFMGDEVPDINRMGYIVEIGPAGSPPDTCDCTLVPNTYQVIYDADASWADAQAAAAAAGGYLVSITSAEEQAYVECLIIHSNPSGPGGFWIGLREVTEGIYTWDNGEVLSYTHWYVTEPNNAFGLESRGQILWSNDFSRRGFWNDVVPEGYMGSETPDINRLGYVIEIGCPGAPVPTCTIPVGVRTPERPGLGLAVRPNPMQSASDVMFEMPAPRFATLSVFDVSGRLVRTLVSGVIGQGRHVIAWDGRTESGSVAAPGIYSMRLSSDGGAQTVKVIRVR